MAIGAGNGSGGGAAEGGYSGGVYWWTSNNLLTPQDPENISTGISNVSEGTQKVASFLSSKGIAVTSWDGVSGEGAISGAVSKALSECQSGNREAVCRLFGVGAFVSTYLSTGSKDFDGSGSGYQNDSSAAWKEAFAEASQGAYTAWNGRSVSYTASTNLGGGKTIDSVVSSQIAADSGEDLSIVVVLLNQSEPPSLASQPPAPPVKSIGEGTLTGGMEDPTSISTSSGEGGTSLIFTDYLNPEGSAYKVVGMKVESGGTDVSSSFAFSTPANEAVATWKGGELPSNKTFTFSFNVLLTSASGKPFKDRAQVSWNGKTQESASHAFDTFAPTANKAWCGQDTAADPEKTNKVGWDGKYFAEGEKVASSVNGEVGSGLFEAPSAFSLTDNFTPSSSIWSPDVSEAKILESSGSLAWEAGESGLKENVTGEFNISQNGEEITASMKPEYLATLKGLPSPLQFTLYIPGAIHMGQGSVETERKAYNLSASQPLHSLLSPSGKAFINEGWETLGTEKAETNQPEIGIYAPTVNKSWETNGSCADPTWSGETGADRHYFLNGQLLDSSINTEVGSGLGGSIPSFSIEDNYANAAWMWKPDPSGAQVYSSTLPGSEDASLSNMSSNQNVTGEFYFLSRGDEITASMKPEYLATLLNLKNPEQFTLVIPGRVQLAAGKGVNAARKEYREKAGAAVSTMLNPGSSTPFSDTASETLSTGVSQSNSPEVGIWIPGAEKSVIGGKAQGGEEESIDGKTVLPGQTLTYELEAYEMIPDLGEQIKSVEIRDQYSPFISPIPSSLEVFQNGELIPLSDYEISWNPSEHEFQAQLGPKAIGAWKSGQDVKLLTIFKAKVEKAGETIKNRWDLVINGSSSASNTVENPSILPVPRKSVDNSLGENVDGKTIFRGQILYYKVELRAKGLKNLAYKIWRLGIIDHFDWRSLKWLVGKTEVLNSAGQNVRNEFNIQEDDHTAFVFFRTVNTFAKATGREISGNPQPRNLEAYAKEKLNPLTTPVINQNVLGQNYTVVLPMEVYGEQDGLIANTAMQETNSDLTKSNTVVNVEKMLQPEKTVSLTIGGKSQEGDEIPLGDDFFYGLESSRLPANRAYQKVSSWTFSDTYESKFDQY
ncbi:MAG: LPXTG cell wall anchor domain-containing protein, partial [Aeriscardovia sp.]|nr:LPXTG cell wall anchor domain-containing protein [Aeriscardovia sp.]